MDRALLEYERKNRATPLGVAYLLRAEGGCDLAALRAAVARKARDFPVLTHRVTHPPAGWPRWAPDPWFDVRAHVRELVLPFGADETDVRELVARRCQERLPPEVSPWEVCLLRAPGATTFYVLFRASHVWLDGTALNRVLTILFGADIMVPRWLRAGRVTGWSLAQAGGRLLGWAAPTAALAALARPFAGAHEVHWASTSVERLRAIGRAHAATVNDVFLVALAGALAAWSPRLGPAWPLRVLMPISTRRPQEREHLGNFVVGARIGLPNGSASLARRFAAVRRQTSRYRDGRAAGAGERWWFERIPARYGRSAVAMGMDSGRVAISTSNLGVLPGSLAIVGHPVTEAVPVPVPVPGQRVFVILGGVGTTACLGVAVDRNVPGGSLLALLWLAELDVLAHAAGLATPMTADVLLAGPRVAC
jgi:diacylglycerol O-acyltransferase